MTTQLIPTRNERAQAAVEAVIRSALPSPAPKDVRIAARDNHSGEPSLYIYVEMPDEPSIPDVGAQNHLSSQLMTALQALDDDRFPYVYFGPRGPEAKPRRRGKNA